MQALFYWLQWMDICGIFKHFLASSLYCSQTESTPAPLSASGKCWATIWVQLSSIKETDKWQTGLHGSAINFRLVQMGLLGFFPNTSSITGEIATRSWLPWHLATSATRLACNWVWKMSGYTFNESMARWFNARLRYLAWWRQRLG